MRIHYLLFYLLFAITASQAQQAKQLIEICDNGIDDDGDGLIDCYDTNNCDCTPIPDCADTVRSSNFAMQLAWEGGFSNFSPYVGTPLVGNLDPTKDSVSEIVIIKPIAPFFYPSSFTDRLLIIKGDGSNKNNPSELTIPTGIRLLYESPISIALADVNADNNPELIVICADKRIRIFNNYDPAAIPVMQLWITSLDTSALGQTTPAVADFDGDGNAEIYAGNEVFVFDFSNPQAPTLRKRLKGTGSAGRSATTNPTPLSECSSFAADLLTVADCNGDPDCEGLEIAAGNMIYSVDIDPNDGDGFQIKIQRNLNLMTMGIPFSDGFTSVADVNLDNIPELLVTGTRGTQEGFYVWNKNGFLRFLGSNGFFLNTPNGSGYIGGQIAVANVYDDRKNGFTKDFPEIIVGDINFINCYNLNAATTNPTKPYWWKKQTDTALNTGGRIRSISIFDFDQNGRPEILLDSYFNGIEVLYGDALPLPMGVDTNRVWFSTTNFTSGYHNGGYSYPVVADTDADGQAEIVVCGGSNNLGAVISVLEAEEVYHSTWASARSTWNQYAYAGVNINDDLSVPKVQQQGHLQIPAGSGQRPLNTFLTQTPLLGIAHEKYMPTPDATVTVLNVQCLGNLKFSVTVKVCNQGIIALPPNLPITFYKDGNPYVSAAINMGTFSISPNSLPPGACVEFTTILQFTGSEVYAMVNDPGIGIFPLTDSDEFWKAECNYLNNAATFKMNPAIGPSLSLGPDINGCTTPIYTFQASAGFASYLWQNGSTAASFTATSPGKYWVAAKDNCLNTRRDTVEIVVDTVLQNLNTAVCEGTNYLFNGTTILAGTTQNFVFTSSASCDSTIRVQVGILPKSQTNEIRQICTGDSTLVFGNFIKNAGSFPKIFPNANGCDSLHTIQVNLLPTPLPTSETRQICNGDSTLVFGNFIKTAGNFPKIFPNTNGCDSLHTIQVTLLPAPLPTSETRQICTGDSTLVFGNFIKTVGNFPKIFPNANGCDSLHTIQVTLLPAPLPTSETRQICTGDSTLVFGNFIKNAGSFPKIFPNTNGCDSLHTIQVTLLPASAPTSEMRQICNGDSTLVFGNFIKNAGSFPKIFPNANGCDSLHTIQVTLLPASLATNETRQICNGDSTLVFGNFIKTAGNFPKIFPNTNGCDSLHTIQVTLLPESAPTSEMRQICNGDSTLVFGNFIKTTGNFLKIFPNANGCDSLHTIDVIVTPILELTDSISFCKGDSIFIFGTWVKSAGITQQLVSGTPHCDTLWTVYVSRIDPPSIDFQVAQPTPLDANGRVIVTAQQDALYGLNGQFFSQKLVYDSLVPGFYTLFQQFKGCLSTLDFQLIPFQKEAPTDIFAPNVFSPNNENDNAVFTLYAPPGLVDQISWFRVYDRWGSMVFEQKNLSPNDETRGWTGLAKGKPAPIGVYIWQAQIKYNDGRELIKSGDTMLIR